MEAYYFSFQIAESPSMMSTEMESGTTLLDVSHRGLDCLPGTNEGVDDPTTISTLQIDNNHITVLDPSIASFTNMTYMDISNNSLVEICNEIVKLKLLHTLIAKNNLLEDDSLPKDFGLLGSLRVLNLSGNNLHTFPPQLTELSELQALYIGANSIGCLPYDIKNMASLEILYAGGNQLTEVPATIGYMKNLAALVLCDNSLASIPKVICELRNLQSLSLHNNKLTMLPREIVELNLLELTLRNNPLVVRFVRDLTYNVPSLQELAARVVKLKRVPYAAHDVPRQLALYLSAAKSCVNPKCRGVYFDARVEHVNFVDFCGKYRVPLLEYLCSPNCTTNPITTASSSDVDSEDETGVPIQKLKRVLLG